MRNRPPVSDTSKIISSIASINLGAVVPDPPSFYNLVEVAVEPGLVRVRDAAGGEFVSTGTGHILRERF